MVLILLSVCVAVQEYHSNRKNRVLIFVLYKKEAARIESNLQRAGWKCTSIHGDKSQDARSEPVFRIRIYYYADQRWGETQKRSVN